MQIKEESPSKDISSLPVSQVQKGNHQKNTFQSNNTNIQMPISQKQNFKNFHKPELNNPSIISQNPSLGQINPSFAMKNQNNFQNTQNTGQNLNQGMANNPMMQMMANMMTAQSQGGNMNQMMMTQFQNFMKQNPQFMMEQMKMMQMNQNNLNTQSTQEIGGMKQNLHNQKNKTNSMTYLNAEKNDNTRGAKNLNKLREKEKEKNNNKIIGKYYFL